GGAHAFFGKKIENDTGVDLAGPCSHRQSVERSKSHGTFDAAAIGHRAHRGAAAQVRNYHAALGRLWRYLAQALCNIFIGKSVEAVTTYAFIVEFLGKCEMVRQRTVVAVERRVEACNLRQFGPVREKRADRGQVVGLMQWRK